MIHKCQNVLQSYMTKFLFWNTTREQEIFTNYMRFQQRNDLLCMYSMHRKYTRNSL